MLPLLLGGIYNRLGAYRGYDDKVNPTSSDHFSTAAFRVVHSMVNSPVLVLDNLCHGWIPGSNTDTPQQEANNCIPIFFRAVGQDAVLRGALQQHAQSLDQKVVNGIRNVFLDTTTPDGNLDVETANIYRGRFHQLLDFNSLREFHTGKSYYDEPHCSPGVSVDPIACWSHHTSNTTLAYILQSIYSKIDTMDAYVGFLTEDIKDPAFMGGVDAIIVMGEFDRLRHGDRFWYENRDYHTDASIRQAKQFFMKDLIELNTGITPTVTGEDSAFLRQEFCHDLAHAPYTVFPNPSGETSRRRRRH